MRSKLWQHLRAGLRERVAHRRICLNHALAAMRQRRVTADPPLPSSVCCFDAFLSCTFLLAQLTQSFHASVTGLPHDGHFDFVCDTFASHTGSHGDPPERPPHPGGKFTSAKMSTICDDRDRRSKHQPFSEHIPSPPHVVNRVMGTRNTRCPCPVSPAQEARAAPSPSARAYTQRPSTLASRFRR